MGAPPEQRRGHLLRAALMVGGGLAVKMQAISFWGIFIVLLVVWLWRRTELDWGDRLRSVGAFVGVAAVLACPWYLKSLIWTGNPVYPFAHGVFGGRDWTKPMAAGYARHQKEFGMGPLPENWQELPPLQRLFCGPRELWKWPAGPWNATMYPWRFATPVNPLAVYLCYAVGPLHLALLLPLVLLVRRKPPVVVWLLVLAGLMFLGWLALMQYSRYLLPCVAVLALPEAYAVGRLSEWGGLARGAAYGALGLSTLLSLAFLALMVVPVVPVVLGLETEEHFLSRALEVYPACAYINHETTREVTVALLGEPRGFYLDRKYFWCDPGHNTIVAWDQVHSGRDFVRELRRAGADYLLAAPGTMEAAYVARGGMLGAFKEAIDQGYLFPAFAAGPRTHIVFALRSVD